MGTNARIIAYNYNENQGGCSDFSLNTYWGLDYKNIFYLCGDLGRPQFEDIIETSQKETGQTTRTQDTSIERNNLSVLAISPLLQFLKTISKHDVKQIEFLDSGDVYDITNVDIDDTGDTLTPNNLVYIWFEGEPMSKVSETIDFATNRKLAFWDNNNDGTADIGGNARYSGGTSGLFSTWQLYFEADAVTPATSGDVMLQVYTISKSGLEGLVGIFRGQFTDLFSDSTKWQSSQNIWDYFDVSNTVGHTNPVVFDKEAFSLDNGYLSNEQDEKAVEIRFELSIDGSTEQLTYLKKVYSVWGAFHSSGVQSATTKEYGITTIGKTDYKNTLSTIADVRYLSNGSGSHELITSAVLTYLDAHSNGYVIDVAPNFQMTYECAFTTNGGYIGSNFRAARWDDNFTLSVNGASPVTQNLNILPFTTGTSPYIFSFDWKFDRVIGGGGFPIIGQVVNGTAQTLLNGVLVNTLPTIVVGFTQVLGSQSITLPDTAVNTVRIEVTTDQGYVIFSQFEVQIKPLY